MRPFVTLVTLIRYSFLIFQHKFITDVTSIPVDRIIVVADCINDQDILYAQMFPYFVILLYCTYFSFLSDGVLDNTKHYYETCYCCLP